MGRHIPQSHQIRDLPHHSVRRRQHQNRGVKHNKHCPSSGTILSSAKLHRSRSDEQNRMGSRSARLAQEAEGAGECLAAIAYPLKNVALMPF